MTVFYCSVLNRGPVVNKLVLKGDPPERIENEIICMFARIYSDTDTKILTQAHTRT